MLLVLLTTVSFAQQITINVETAGTLSSLIAESKKDVITDLKLTGHINYDDILFMKKMPLLENLDITDIVYYDGYGNPGSIAGFDRMPTLKSLVLPKDITKISQAAFANCSKLENVSFPNSIEIIDVSAFGNCGKLISLDLPVSLKKIGMEAFKGCQSLKSVIIPESVTEMHSGVFMNCTSLETIVLPNNFTDIPAEFVRYCTALKSFVIPDEVQYVRRWALDGCRNLTDLVIGRKVVSMDNSPIGNDNNLENIVFKCRKIDHSWFYGYKNLKTIAFETTVQSIDAMSFQNCTNIESIHIPNSIASIGEKAFYGCTGLREITVDENNPNYSALNNALFNKDQTTLITFANSSSDNFTVPETVANIEEYAFYNCSNLNSLTIPASVTEIGDNALYDCKKLEKIYCYATTPPAVQAYTFYNVDKWLCTLYVPVGSYSAYWLAPGWGDFINIEEYDPTGIQTVTDSANEGVRYYSVDGRELTSPQAGINLVKYSNGTIRKIFK